jgi:murein DD-endopeptidase MepM/ murein hydrolase activator NlpD
MTDLLFRGTVLGLLSGGLVACAMTPTYPTAAPDAAAHAAAPTSPTPPAAVPPPPPPPEAAPSAPPPGVESQPLAPVTPPQSAPPSSASATAAPPPPATMAPVPDYGRESARYTATGKVVEAHRMFRDYVVRKGDHLDAIARDLETTRATLLEANHLKSPDALRPGQHLKVPVEKAYVAAPGDTVAAVARRFDISAADLADLNAISESHRLRAGEELALPSSFHDRGPVTLPPARSYARYPPPTASYSRYAPPGGGYTPSPWTSSAGARPAAPYPSVATVSPPTRTDSQVMAAGKGRFVWPVRGEILSAFGVQDVDRRNDGVDIRSPTGTAVHAAAAGEVVYAGDQVPGFGNLVLVKHADGWVTAYAHLARVDVKMRDNVSQDQEIGQVGQTGGVSEPQLHFEVRYAATPIEKARPVNPLLVLPE